MKKKNQMIQNRYFGRRQFLIGSGQFMLTLPPLLSLMSSKAVAQVTGPKVRVFTCIGVFGIDDYQLYPSDNTILNATTDPNINWKALNQLPTKVSRILDFTAPELAGLQSKTNLIRGLGLTGGNWASHNHSVLSGTHSGGRSPIYGESVDVVIEQALGVNAIRVKTRNGTGKANEFSFSRDSSGNRKISNLTFGDQALFNLLFPGGPTGTNPPPTTNNSNNEKLVVDKVFDDLQNLMNNPRISQNDKGTLSDYIDSVQDLQKRIVQSNSGGSFTCSVPSMNFEVRTGATSVSSADQLFENYASIMTLAAQCDNARVFHIANTAISNSNADAAHPELHHDCTGGSDGAADRQGWFLKRVARLAKKLDAVTDPYDSSGKSLLDNSIILWTNELGSWTTAHLVTNIPVVTFGGAGGQIRTGQFMDFRRRPFITAKRTRDDLRLGHPYKQLLISMMKAAGLSRNQYINIGDGNGFGEFKEGIASSDYPTNAYSLFKNTHNDPLPYFSI